MAARSLFFTLTRNARGDKKIPCRSISSSINAVTQKPITTTSERVMDEFTEEENDDLKSRIFRLRLPKRSAANVLQKWVCEGNKITLSDLRSISRDLRRSHRYKHALEISEWMVSHGEYQLSDTDYAVRVDLMTRVFGIDAAERYFEGLPSSAKTSETYTALLHCYAGLKLVEKAENFFERIKGANLPLSAITYNELMTLYMSVGQVEKVALIIEEMKRQNVEFDLFTYNLWLSSCAAALNMDEAKRILDEMSTDSSCDERWIRYIKLANIYITSGQLVNADFSSLMENDQAVTQIKLISYDFLVILYGGLGDKHKVDQICASLRMTKQKLMGRNYVCLLSSYLMLGHLKEVGDMIDQWKQSTISEFSLSMCSKLLETYKDLGMTDKATSFHTILREKGCVLIDDSK